MNAKRMILCVIASKNVVFILARIVFREPYVKFTVERDPSMPLLKSLAVPATFFKCQKSHGNLINHRDVPSASFHLHRQSGSGFQVTVWESPG